MEMDTVILVKIKATKAKRGRITLMKKSWKFGQIDVGWRILMQFSYASADKVK